LGTTVKEAYSCVRQNDRRVYLSQGSYEPDREEGREIKTGRHQNGKGAQGGKIILVQGTRTERFGGEKNGDFTACMDKKTDERLFKQTNHKKVARDGSYLKKRSKGYKRKG